LRIGWRRQSVTIMMCRRTRLDRHAQEVTGAVIVAAPPGWTAVALPLQLPRAMPRARCACCRHLPVDISARRSAHDSPCTPCSCSVGAGARRRPTPCTPCTCSGSAGARRWPTPRNPCTGSGCAGGRISSPRRSLVLADGRPAAILALAPPALVLAPLLAPHLHSVWGTETRVFTFRELDIREVEA